MTEPTCSKELVLAEIGRCLLAYQQVEHLLKFLLPHVHAPGSAVAPDWHPNWRELLDSKETLGGLMKILAKRVSSEDPTGFAQSLSALVDQRNEIVHHFVGQPFARLETDAQCREAMRFISSRRTVVEGFRQQLRGLAAEFAKALEPTARGTNTDPATHHKS